MPAKKIVSKAKKVSKIKSKPVNKVKKYPPKSSLPKVKLKTGQPVLVRRSIMYVFVSSLILLFLINAFPAAIANLFSPHSEESNAVVLGEEIESNNSGKINDGSNKDTGVTEATKQENEQKREAAKKADEKAREAFKKQQELTRKNGYTPSVSKSVTVTINPEGVKTVTETEVENGNTKSESKMFDSTGARIGESKIEEQLNKTEIKSKTFGSTGVENSYQFKDKNGSVVMLKVRDGEGSSSVLYNEKNGMLLVKQKGAEAKPSNITPKPSLTSTLGVTPEETIEVTKGEKPTPIPTVLEHPAEETLAIKINTGGNFDLIKNGITANTDLPVEVDGEKGLVYVDNTKLSINPDDAVNEAKKTKGLDTVENVTITKQNGVTTYMVKGVDSQKFLGLFDVTLPKTLYYSVDTNTLVNESKSSIQSLLDAFSF